MKKLIVLILAIVALNTLSAQKANSFNATDYINALKQATDIMVNDVASPVAAARYYSYINLAASETATLFDKQQPSFAEKIKGFKGLKIDDQLIANGDEHLATILAVYKASARLLPSGYLMQKKIDSVKTIAEKKKIGDEKIWTTYRLVDSVVNQVIGYAATDGFGKLSGLKRFTPQKADEYWQPTAPGFMSALEPHWYTLRTFILDSCTQFACQPPYKYSKDTNSLFYQQLKEVYVIGKNLTKQQTDIANFWDCNPFALQQVGHLEFGIKKISPGGHWMGITGIACKQKKLSLSRTAYTHALVAMTIADGFISCWNEKYKYNRVRPVTAIKKLIDQNWVPLLQTPPFPEYTSGHSVISTAAATVLTYLFGASFYFTDHTEEEFGLPSRKFKSFNDAAQEAAISRLYGGIHFRDAIENGAKEGEDIGKFVIAHFPTNYINTSKALSASTKKNRR